TITLSFGRREVRMRAAIASRSARRTICTGFTPGSCARGEGRPTTSTGRCRGAASKGISGCRDAHHGFDLEEFLEAELAPLAAVAALLVAAERRIEVRAGAVDVHVAGAKP